MMESLKKQFKKSIPDILVESLFKEYEKVKYNFLLNKHEPSELNAGKFCEVVIRIIQNQTSQPPKYTPLGTQINNFFDIIKTFERLPNGITNESFKLHIPRVLAALYNIRNKRGVGHVGGDITPNISDSTFLNTGCDWIMAELVRIFYSCSIEEAENIIKIIVKRKAPLVYSLGDRKRVLKIKDYDKIILLLLLEEYPKKITIHNLFLWSEHSNITNFKKKLNKLHKEYLIDCHNQECLILPAGIEIAEQIIIDNN